MRMHALNIPVHAYSLPYIIILVGFLPGCRVGSDGSIGSTNCKVHAGTCVRTSAACSACTTCMQPLIP